MHGISNSKKCYNNKNAETKNNIQYSGEQVISSVMVKGLIEV